MPVPVRTTTTEVVSNSRGIALIAVMLALLVVFALASAFMSVTVGERSLSGNVHVARSALFAADAGVRMMQQSLANTAYAKLDSIKNFYSGSGALISNPTTLFPAGAISTSATTPHFSATASITFSDSVLQDTAQVYNYNYTINSTGGAGAFGSRRVQSQGILRVSASRGSFADFLMFTQTHTMADGTAIWFSSSSTFDGRVHTNGEFRFAYSPSFYDQVTSVNTKAWYYDHGSSGGNGKELSANNNGVIDVPSFYGGFSRGATAIPIPANSNMQQNASLGLPSGGSAPSNATIDGRLGLPGNGNPNPGIYVVNSGGAVTGGFYVQGTLDHFTMSVDSSGRQIYDLRQNSTEKIITVDRTANTTSVNVGGTTTTYTGLPSGVMYVNGDVHDFKGPDRGVDGLPTPAIADGTQFLVAATGDVVMQGDVTCANYDTGSGVLGIYSSGGNVRVGTSAPSGMYLDAFVMATGPSGAFQVDNYGSGSPRGTFHLRGGAVARYYGAFYTFDSNGNLLTGFARDFHYDRRGLIPPFYPSTSQFVPDQPTARTLVWKEY